jgi:hypothetical protein
MKGLLYSRTREEFFYNLVVFLVWVALMTLFMRFLWNAVLVKHITILRPVDSLTQTFLLALGISLFHL